MISTLTDIEYRSDQNNKAASVEEVRIEQIYYTTTFGRYIDNGRNGLEFVVSHSKPTKLYKTLKGADKAARKWLEG